MARLAPSILPRQGIAGQAAIVAGAWHTSAKVAQADQNLASWTTATQAPVPGSWYTPLARGVREKPAVSTLYSQPRGHTAAPSTPFHHAQYRQDWLALRQWAMPYTLSSQG